MPPDREKSCEQRNRARQKDDRQQIHPYIDLQRPMPKEKVTQEVSQYSHHGHIASDLVRDPPKLEDLDNATLAEILAALKQRHKILGVARNQAQNELKRFVGALGVTNIAALLACVGLQGIAVKYRDNIESFGVEDSGHSKSGRP